MEAADFVGPDTPASDIHPLPAVVEHNGKIEALWPLKGKLVDFIGYDAESAVACLRRIVYGLRQANAINVFFRYALGKQLVTIQKRELWKVIFAEGVDDRPTSFSDWLHKHFRALTGMGRETAFGAMQLARCEALNRLPDHELLRFDSIGNALLLARMERETGRAVDQDTIRQAQEMPLNEFRQQVGLPPQAARVEAIVEPAAVNDITLLLALFRNAEPDGVKALRDAIEEMALPLCGGNPKALMDFLVAAIQHEYEAHFPEESFPAGGIKENAAAGGDG